MPRRLFLASTALAGLLLAGCQSHTGQVADILASDAATPLPQPAFGDPAPEFKPVGWYLGGPADLVAGKDGITVFYLQAMTYTHTKRAVARLEALYRRFHDKGLVVVGYEGKSPNDEWRKSVASDIRSKGVIFPVAELDDGADKAWSEWDVFYYPRVVVVKNGRVIRSGNVFALTDAVVGDMLAGRYDAARAEKDQAAERLRYDRMKRMAAILKKETASGRWESAMDLADKYLAALPEDERFVAENVRGLAMQDGGGHIESINGHVTVEEGPNFDRYRMSKLQSELKQIEKAIDDNYPGVALARLEALQRNPWYEDEFMLQFFTPVILSQTDRPKMRDYVRKNFLATDAYGQEPDLGAAFGMIAVALSKKEPEDIALAREIIAAAKNREAETDTLDYYGAIVDLAEGKIDPAKATLTRLAESAKKEEIRKNSANVLRQMNAK